jgi:acid stress-induced BolA-like protein IbaG/YrbA
MQLSELQNRLAQALDADPVALRTEDMVHFEAIVVSPRFVGQTRLSRQQMVYAVLHAEIQSGQIHALSLRTMTPEEWARSQPS